jgi:hypothetical protein
LLVKVTGCVLKVSGSVYGSAWRRQRKLADEPLAIDKGKKIPVSG